MTSLLANITLLWLDLLVMLLFGYCSGNPLFYTNLHPVYCWLYLKDKDGCMDSELHPKERREVFEGRIFINSSSPFVFTTLFCKNIH